jgi:hypothetical protein
VKQVAAVVEKLGDLVSPYISNIVLSETQINEHARLVAGHQTVYEKTDL